MVSLKENLANFFFEDDHSDKLYLKAGSLDYLAEGKALRSKICIALGENFYLEKSQAALLGQTIEMIHNATLIHDDVVDYSHFRRGSETLNSFYGNKKSVLVGDYILAKAIADLSELNKPSLVAAIATALKSLVDGEIFQMEHTDPFDISEENYLKLAKNKTGSLFAWSFSSVVDLKFGDDSLSKSMHEIGQELGILFQIKDDLLDFTVENKTKALDLRNNNINFVFSLFKHSDIAIKNGFRNAQSIDDLTSDQINYLMDKKEIAERKLEQRAIRIKNLVRSVCNEHLEEKYWRDFTSFVESFIKKITMRTF
jgi:geranylgeranyl pyrophosphate synthase